MKDGRWRKLSKQIREETKKCEVCGSTAFLNCHHILPWQYYKLYRYEIKNIICVCCRCHTFSGKSFEKNAVWSSEWLKEHKPKQWQWVKEHI